MPRNESDFDYNADAGVRYIAKVVVARETTAGDFDAKTNSTLSEKIGSDTKVFHYQVENLEAKTPGSLRGTFFKNDSAPVSKWKRWLKAHKNIGVSLKRNPDGSTNLEGMYFEVEEKEVPMGKYGTSNTIEPIGIPTPEDIEVLEKARAAAFAGPPEGEVVTAAAAVVAQPEAVADDSRTMILIYADGNQTVAQMEADLNPLPNTKKWKSVYEGMLKAGEVIQVDGKVSIPLPNSLTPTPEQMAGVNQA